MKILGYNIRSTGKEDLPAILELFKALPATEKKYLALDKKKDVIRREIRTGRHAFVLDMGNGMIAAYARESGRPNKYIMLEEIVVHPEARQQGLGSKLLAWLLNKYSKAEAKTFASNDPIAGLLRKHRFRVVKTSPKGEILYWEHS